MTDFSRFFELFDHPWLLCSLVLMNWPLYRRLAQELFGNAAGLGAAIKFRAVSDFHSLLKTQYLEDQWAELKLSAWFLLCILVILVEYTLAAQLLEWWYEDVVSCSLHTL